MCMDTIYNNGEGKTLPSIYRVHGDCGGKGGMGNPRAPLPFYESLIIHNTANITRSL